MDNVKYCLIADNCDKCLKLIYLNKLIEITYNYSEYYGAKSHTDTIFVCKKCKKKLK